MSDSEKHKTRILASKLFIGILIATVFISWIAFMAFVLPGCGTTDHVLGAKSTSTTTAKEDFCKNNKKDIKQYRTYLEKEEWPGYSKTEEKSRRRNIRKLIEQYQRKCNNSQ